MFKSFLTHISRMLFGLLLIIVTAIPARSAQAVTTGTISGTLYDDYGSAITWAAVRVRILRKSNGNQLAQTISNPADGSFRLTGLPLNTALVVVASDETPDTDGYLAEYYNNVSTREWAETIQLTSGAPSRTNLEISLGTGEFGATVEHLTFNVRTGRLLNDVNLRRAIAYGTNRPQILYDAFLPGGQMGIILHTFVAPGLWHQASRNDLTVYPYNPVMADNILTTAGWTDTDSDGIRENAQGIELELDFKTTTASVRTQSALLFTQQMLDIGIRVNVTQYPASDFFSDDPAISPLAAGDFDIAEFAWVLEEPDNLISVYNSGDGQNYGGVLNTTLDGYYTQARDAKVAGNPSTFQSKALLWQQTYADILPSLPLFTRVNVDGVEVPGGTNVLVQADQASALFGNVSSGGWFGIVGSRYNPDDLPVGYVQGDPNVYGVGANAVFDTANVCIHYDAGQMSTANEYFLRLFHLEGLVHWADVTTSLDVDENQICGDFQSFSDVALMYDDSVGGSISGTVRAQDGTPVTDKPVTVMAEREDGQVLATTDSNPADGSYSITGLPLDVDLIMRVAGDDTYGAEYYEESILHSTATIFHLTLGAFDYTGVDFTLPPAQPGATLEQLTFNVGSGRVLSDPVIRQAIALATDREKILNAAFLPNETSAGSGAHTYGVVLNSLVAPGYWFQPAHDQVTIYPYDPAQANAILDAAGILDTNDNGIRETSPGNDINLDFKTTFAPARGVSAAIFAENMAAIGLQITITQYSGGDFFSDDPALSPLVAGDFDIAEFAWVGSDHNLDDAYLWQIYETGNGQNFGGYSNSTVDSELASAQAATDRTSLLPHMLAYLAEAADDMPSLPLFTRVAVTPVNTSAGREVTANLLDVSTTVEYENAASAGVTGGYLSNIHPDDLPDYLVQMLEVYEIGSNVTMAQGTGALICFGYDDTGLTTSQENRLQLYHLSMTGTRVWSNITAALDTDANTLCGWTTSFSTFVLGFPDGPVVNSMIPVDTNPTDAASVHFAVNFSEAVTGVSMDDFTLTTTGVTDASITGVSGSDAAYTVTINTGSGNGTIRLNVVDDDSIQNAANDPLGGEGSGNGNFTSGEVYAIIETLNISSTGADDGWILETTEFSGLGGTLNKNATTLRAGDDAANKQYRAILSFDTSTLPEGAVITSVTLKFKHAGVSGTTPFKTHGKLLADICEGAFKNDPALQLADFNAKCPVGFYKAKALIYSNTKVDNWYSQSLNPLDFQFINVEGVTQLRLRFAKDDNNDFGADFLKLYSGDVLNEADRPQLVIEYYVP